MLETPPSTLTLILLPGGVLMLVAGLVLWLRWEQIHRRVGVWGTVGTALGWFMIGLGCIGGLLPILPGFPMGILGLLLLGPNDPLIRWTWQKLHQRARQLSTSRRESFRRSGLRILDFEARLVAHLRRHGHTIRWLESAQPPSAPPAAPDAPSDLR